MAVVGLGRHDDVMNYVNYARITPQPQTTPQTNNRRSCCAWLMGMKREAGVATH